MVESSQVPTEFASDDYGEQSSNTLFVAQSPGRTRNQQRVLKAPTSAIVQFDSDQIQERVKGLIKCNSQMLNSDRNPVKPSQALEREEMLVIPESDQDFERLVGMQNLSMPKEAFMREASAMGGGLSTVFERDTYLSRKISEIKRTHTLANLTYQPRLAQVPEENRNTKANYLIKQVKREIKKMFSYDICCSICLSQFVKPVSLQCGHSFCQFCILKFLLQYPKKCPLCRTAIKVCYQDLKVNVSLDAISFKYNPRDYNKIRALNDQEFKKSQLFEKLAKKFLDSQNYRPSSRERIRLFLHHMKWYYKRIRAVITIIAPIIILYWYIRYRKQINSDQYWEKVRKHNMMFFSVPFDLTQETMLVRLSQVFSILVGF